MLSILPPARFYLRCNDEVTAEKFEEIMLRGVESFKLLFIDNLHITSSFRDTLLMDKINTTDEALIEIYRRLRPGDPHNFKKFYLAF